MRWKFLMRPGWLGLIGLVLLFSAVCFTVLAPWQFRQDARKDAQNTAITQSADIAPAPYAELLPPGTNPAERNWRQVSVTGQYLPNAEALVRLRNVQGEAAFEVLTPLRTQSGQQVLINRGFVRLINGNKPAPFTPPPAGEVTVVGKLRVSESDMKSREVLNQDGYRQVYAINPDIVGAATGLTLQPGYVQLNAEQPGVLGALPLPKLDSGPHFSYALQWAAFGLMAPIGLVFLLWREVNPEQPAESASVPASPQHPSPTTYTTDRYGNRR